MTSKEKAAYYREWRRRNPEKVREAKRKCREKNRAKYRASERAWKLRNPEKAKRYLLNQQVKRYGITGDDYRQMLVEQEDRCAICNRHRQEFSRRFHVDHDHDTGVVRCLLCGDCNSGLGLFQEKPELLEMAAQYLRRFGRV